MAEKAKAFALRAASKILRFVSGYPMRRVEIAMDNSGRHVWVWRDRNADYWLANGPWSLRRKRAAFDMQGFWVEA